MKNHLIYADDRDNSQDLDIDKRDEHLFLTHQDCNDFRKLPEGLYDLEYEVDRKKVNYPVYLTGNEGVSLYQTPDLNKTYVEPNYIDDMASEVYEIFIELRGKDGLRWIYEVNLNILEYTNSYGLGSYKFIVEEVPGPLSGQMRLKVNQTVENTPSKDNFLFLKYEKQPITQTVILHIKCDDTIWGLVYDSGAVDGTLVNPSIVKFLPLDKYCKPYTDLFNETLYPKSRLETLTKGKS